MDVLTLREYETLSPFEIKDFLAKAALKATKSASMAYLNAGRGNPNWIATEPREAFFLLGQFAILESKRTMELPAGVGGMPKPAGVADRLEGWLRGHRDMPGAPFLEKMVPWTVKRFGFEPDKFVHELVDSIIGDNYPVPDRMLVHNEQIVHEYLQWAMCGTPRPNGKFKLYAVEGGTAAMCYIFKSMKANRLLNPGDTIALGVPIFTPYLEMPHLEDYDLKIVDVRAPQENRFQFTDDELKKLLDPKIKAFFVVNPGNPSAMALSADTIKKIGAILKKRPDLILLTDDVYGTFVPGFRSLLGEFPKNTIGVYSYSKYFGCTGWRLGVIAVHDDNIFDDMIAKHPEATQKKLDKRYGALTLEPRKIKFIDRIVADSRDIALNHTAGLSLPQQVMMSLFSLAELMDEKKTLPEGLHRHRQEAGAGDHRGARDRRGSQPQLRLLLRPGRSGVLDAQVRGRRRGQVGQGQRPPPRHRVPAGRGSRHRAAQRQRLRRAELVGARVVRQPERRRVRRHRPRGARGGAQLLPGLSAGDRQDRRQWPGCRRQDVRWQRPGRRRQDGQGSEGLTTARGRRASARRKTT